jgi:hypothetical protein
VFPLASRLTHLTRQEHESNENIEGYDCTVFDLLLLFPKRR